jgi:hypothetical protein
MSTATRMAQSLHGLALGKTTGIRFQAETIFIFFTHTSIPALGHIQPIIIAPGANYPGEQSKNAQSLTLCLHGLVPGHKTNITSSVKFEVFTAVRMIMFIFWVLAPCRLVGRCQRFGEAYTAVSIFTAEAGEICFSETLASTDESTRRQNPKHHYQ